MSRDVPDDAEWNELLKASPNGFFVILLALHWWYRGIEFDGANVDDWTRALEDVAWVMRQMKSHIQLSRKHIRDESDEPEAKRYVLF
jgi:hypothetical protein